MIRHIDYWIGTRFFHPPIISLCQRTGMSQWAVASYAWMAGGFSLLMQIRITGPQSSILYAVVATVVAVAATLAAALIPNTPRRPSAYFRFFICLVTAIGLADLIVWPSRANADLMWGFGWDLCGLIAEYAKTIATIPPRSIRIRRRIKDYANEGQ